ncbi:MAG: thiamine phosphate synthase [Acidobacteriota bacterium]
MQPRRRLPSCIYPITDPAQAGSPSHAALTRALLRGGARWLQLRDKSRTASELVEDFRRACREARKRGALAIINDRVDLVLAVGAAGVHVGEEDLPAQEARRLLGPAALIGVSTHSVSAAERASRLPVDYVALGPIYRSPSRPGAHRALGLEPLRRARTKVALPLVAIGGINTERLAEVLRAGADAAAIISGVCAAPEGAEARVRVLIRDARRVVAQRLLKGRHLYVVGFMGAGKSSVGPVVARALSRPFIDLDREIECAAGMRIAELFDRCGEAHFRLLERRTLFRVSRGREAVIALGGGALGEPSSVRCVRRTGRSVWLHASFETLQRRCRGPGAPERPLMRDRGLSRRLYRTRQALYSKSDFKVSTARLDEERVAARILAWVERREG